MKERLLSQSKGKTVFKDSELPAVYRFISPDPRARRGASIVVACVVGEDAVVNSAESSRDGLARSASVVYAVAVRGGSRRCRGLKGTSLWNVCIACVGDVLVVPDDTVRSRAGLVSNASVACAEDLFLNCRKNGGAEDKGFNFLVRAEEAFMIMSVLRIY